MNTVPSPTLETIRELSRIGSRKQTTVVDRLLDARWCEPDDLEIAFSRLQETQSQLAVVLFQLPFNVRLPSDWTQIPHRIGTPHVCFRTIGTLQNLIRAEERVVLQPEVVAFGKFAPFENAVLQGDPTGSFVRTQVFVSFEIWAPWSAFYGDYLRAARSERGFGGALVPRARSWRHDHAALTCALYEIDLFDHLASEALHVVKGAMKRYAVSCRDQAAWRWTEAAERACHCLLMVQSGRVVAPRSGQPLLADYVEPFRQPGLEDNRTAFLESLASNRPVSVYEEYLLDAADQIRRGSTRLAVVQAVMILDWFANELIEDHLMDEVRRAIPDAGLAEFTIDHLWETPKGRRRWRVRVRLIDKFREYMPLMRIRLSDEQLRRLKKVIDLRNAIVHREQVSTVTLVTATAALDSAFEVVEAVLTQLIRAHAGE